MRRLVVSSSLAAVLVSLLLPASALTLAPPERARVAHTDFDSTDTDGTVDIERVTFNNGGQAIKMTAFVGYLAPAITTGQARMFLTTNRGGDASYLAQWDAETDRTELIRLNRGYEPVRCDGLRFQWQGAPDDGSGKPGAIKFKVPQSCLTNTSRVRFNVHLINTRLNVNEPIEDYAPGDSGQYSVWVRRG